MPVPERVDVVVVGGGSAGVAAAVAAARMGVEVLLVERYPFLGGAGTNSSVACFCGFYTSGPDPELVVDGLGGEMVARLQRADGCLPPFRAQGSRNTVVPFHPEALKRVLDEMVVHPRLRVRLHTWVVGAEVEDGRVQAVSLFSKGGQERVAAQVFVDTSGDGDLLAFSGAEFVVGDEEDGKLQSATMMFSLSGVDWDRLSRLTREEITALILQAVEEGWPHIGAYPGLFIPLPGGEVLAAFHKDPDVNGLDPDSLTRGEMDARAAVESYVRLFRERFPGCEGARLVRTGPQIGIRETRRMVGRHVLTGREAMEGTKFPDGVARGGWPVEIHEKGQGKVYARYGYIRGDSYYRIPAAALLSRTYPNLLAAGRCLSSTHGAQASARVMGTAWATGHAAGVMAAILVQRGLQLPYGELVRLTQAELVRQGALI